MAKRRQDYSDDEIKVLKKRLKPATSPEEEENQMIALAINLVKKRLVNGTASAQEVTHFLKLGSTKEQAEKQKLNKEIQLLEAKADSIKSAQKTEEMYEQAMDALKRYKGVNGDE